ncbi:MAG: hypothetical protein GY777_17775 [Candidatus Brocadiaceae bacterium]|nr:hypothetical protein [Candidatus Brocadiaceae bacterium]
MAEDSEKPKDLKKDREVAEKSIGADSLFGEQKKAANTEHVNLSAQQISEIPFLV